MIRPITLLCFLLACASGLYLYQEKHRVQMIDREIEQTVHKTDAIREQTRVLHAEWTLLNDPQRLQALADHFLSLKTVAPGQFTSLAELDSRLPPVTPPEPPPQEAPAPSAAAPTDTPVAQQAPAPEPPAAPTPAVADKPVAAAAVPPPSDKPVIAATAPSVPAEHKPSPVVKPQVAAVTPAPRSEPKHVERHAVLAQAARPLPLRPLPAMPSQPAAPFGGSALGMAHGGFVPPPRPMPVNASQWVQPGGGGG